MSVSARSSAMQTTISQPHQRGMRRCAVTVGWQGWPLTARQLGILARGLVALERAASCPPGRAIPIDLAALRAVVDVLSRKE